MTQRQLSCVIPAFNEAPRIKAVLHHVVGHPAIDEVIVVDDGSTDGTADIVAALPGVRLIRMAQNGGKSRAVATGIDACSHDLVLLLDSDLVGLSGADLDALILPVRHGQADVSISLRGNAPGLWRLLGLDYISGERVISKTLLGPVAELRKLPRFGLEVHMNARIIAARARIAVINWPDVASPWKGAKQGTWAGLMADARMLGDMFRTISLPAAVAQIWNMRRLRIAN